MQSLTDELSSQRKNINLSLVLKTTEWNLAAYGCFWFCRVLDVLSL